MSDINSTNNLNNQKFTLADETSAQVHLIIRSGADRYAYVLKGLHQKASDEIGKKVWKVTAFAKEPNIHENILSYQPPLGGANYCLSEDGVFFSAPSPVSSDTFLQQYKDVQSRNTTEA